MISSQSRKKCTGSPVPNTYTRIHSLYWKLEAVRSKTYEDNEDSKNSGSFRTMKFSHIEDITYLVQEWHNQASQQFRKGMEYNGLRSTYSPLSRKITTFCFLRKYVMPIFNHYSGTFDPLIHLLQY